MTQRINPSADQWICVETLTQTVTTQRFSLEPQMTGSKGYHASRQKIRFRLGEPRERTLGKTEYHGRSNEVDRHFLLPMCIDAAVDLFLCTQLVDERVSRYIGISTPTHLYSLYRAQKTE
ncbi:hypothetical protein V2G26_015370 [Clonostachys chloroleuca]